MTKATGRLLQQLATFKAAPGTEDALFQQAEGLALNLEKGMASLNEALYGSQTTVYPLLSHLSSPHEAGDMTPLDHIIVARGGTTSTYLESPHALLTTENSQMEDSIERGKELLTTNRNLCTELKYYSHVRESDSKSRNEMLNIYAQWDVLSAQMRRLVDERITARRNAASALLSYRGIDSDPQTLEALAVGRIEKI